MIAPSYSDKDPHRTEGKDQGLTYVGRTTPLLMINEGTKAVPSPADEVFHFPASEKFPLLDVAYHEQAALAIRVFSLRRLFHQQDQL